MTPPVIEHVGRVRATTNSGSGEADDSSTNPDGSRDEDDDRVARTTSKSRKALLIGLLIAVVLAIVVTVAAVLSSGDVGSDSLSAGAEQDEAARSTTTRHPMSTSERPTSSAPPSTAPRQPTPEEFANLRMSGTYMGKLAPAPCQGLEMDECPSPDEMRITCDGICTAVVYDFYNIPLRFDGRTYSGWVEAESSYPGCRGGYVTVRVAVNIRVDRVINDGAQPNPWAAGKFHVNYSEESLDDSPGCEHIGTGGSGAMELLQ